MRHIATMLLLSLALTFTAFMLITCERNAKDVVGGLKSGEYTIVEVYSSNSNGMKIFYKDKDSDVEAVVLNLSMYVELIESGVVDK